MKAIRSISVWIGLLAFGLNGFAQDNPSPAATNAPSESVVVAPAAAETKTIIPLIQYVDVPVTTAIENLARQAGLNYIIDPKVPFGQVGPDGKIAPQPTLSIRWEKLTAEQALNTVLNNYGLQLVEDPKANIARITVKDPAAPDPLETKIIQLKYAGPSNMVAAIQTTLTDKRSRVLADNRTSQLIVVATEKELAQVDSLVVQLDTPTRQVLIEARLLETTKNPRTFKGVDWSGTAEAQNISFGNNTYRPSASDSVNDLVAKSPIPRILMDTAKGFNPATAFLDADGVSAVLSFINKDGDSQILSTPRTVTLDNQEAMIAVVRAQPVFNTTAGTQGSPGGSQVTYTNLGTILHVTPRIAANDFIDLTVRPEVSNVGGVSRKIVGGTANEADIYDIRTIRTEVLIPSGNTLVLGGLVSDDRTKDTTKVPILGDIPGLGYLFRSESKTQNKKNLIIFITPTIVRDTDYQPTETDYLKTKFADLNDESWESPMNSTTPKDWSKPKPVYDESLVTPPPQ